MENKNLFCRIWSIEYKVEADITLRNKGLERTNEAGEILLEKFSSKRQLGNIYIGSIK